MLLVEAVWDHVAMLADELPFNAGDIITVVEPHLQSASCGGSGASGLWYGVCRDRSGWFPAAYVSVKDHHDHYLLSRMVNSDEGDQDDSASLKSGNTESGSSAEESSAAENFPPAMRYLRKKIVEELINTERDYVQLLNNLIEGFADQCRRRKELFNEERLRRVFGNLEQIRSLHAKFLRDMEACFNRKSPETSCVANPFLRHVSFIALQQWA